MKLQQLRYPAIFGLFLLAGIFSFNSFAEEIAASRFSTIPSAFGGVITEGAQTWIVGGWNQKGMQSSVLHVTKMGHSIELTSTNSTWRKRSYFPIAKIGKKHFLAAGFDYMPPSNVLGDVWSTTNMTDWDLVAVDPPWEQREAHALVAENNTLYLYGGVTYFRPDKHIGLRKGEVKHLRLFSDVWKSGDGFEWEKVRDKAPWGPRRSFGYAVLKNKMWLWGGTDDATSTLYNDIWSSKDGISWNQEGRKVNWSARMINNPITSFRGRIWLIGGGGSATSVIALSDIWASADGIEWELIVEKAPFPPRCGAFIFSMKDDEEEYLFVYGGLNDNSAEGRTFYRDLWRSGDGKHWEKIQEDIVDALKKTIP